MPRKRDLSEFGEKLHALMERHSVKQITLAKKCGLARGQAVQGWLKNGRIDKPNLISVANYFGFTGDALWSLSLDEVLAMDDAMDSNLEKRRMSPPGATTLDAAIMAPASNQLAGLHPLAVDAAHMMHALVKADPSLVLIRDVHSRLWTMIQELTLPRPSSPPTPPPVESHRAAPAPTKKRSHSR